MPCPRWDRPRGRAFILECAPGAKHQDACLRNGCHSKRQGVDPWLPPAGVVPAAGVTGGRRRQVVGAWTGHMIKLRRWGRLYTDRPGRIVSRATGSRSGNAPNAGDRGPQVPGAGVWGCARTPTNALACRKARIADAWALRVRYSDGAPARGAPTTKHAGSLRSFRYPYLDAREAWPWTGSRGIVYEL